MENPQAQDPSHPTTVELHGHEFWSLSGKPYFDVVLSRTHVYPTYQMVLPEKMYSVLPSAATPVILTYNGQNWEMTYTGDNPKNRRFDRNWSKFVKDNGLKAGDACVFELMDSCSEKLNFKVQILRGDIPSEYRDMDTGERANRPICIG